MAFYSKLIKIIKQYHMKTIGLICLLAVISIKSFTQIIPVSGTVKDGQGNPIPMAFIRDAQHYYATSADSAGSFLLKADPASTLVAIAANYADAKVKTDNKDAINIVMVKGSSSSANIAASSIGAGNAGASPAFLNNQPVVN
jgi:hypothetical protein